MPTKLSWLIVVIWGIFGLSVWAEQTVSHTYQQCIGTDQQGDPDKAQSYDPATFLVRVDFNFKCTSAFVKAHEPQITALGTLLIAAFTFTLWWSTDKLWNQNERNFTKLERAYLVLGVGRVEIDALGASIPATVRNFGRTFGNVKEMCFYAIPAAPTAGSPSYDLTKLERTDLVVMPAGPPGDLGYMIRAQGQGPYFFVGYARYEDVMGKSHTTRICVRLADNRIKPVGPDAWNRMD